MTESIPKQNFAYGGRNFGHADVLWRGVGAPRGKSAIFHYGVKESEQNKISVFALTIVTAMTSEIQSILQSSRLLTWKRLLQLCFMR